MGKRYNHLSLEEQDKITAMKSEGKGISKIAMVIGRNKGTISRELRKVNMKGKNLLSQFSPQDRQLIKEALRRLNRTFSKA